MYNRIKAYIEKNLSNSRFEHSLSVARTCAYLCSITGLDSDTGKIAGISHDIARELSPDEILKLAEKDGSEITPYERDHPVLLHGRAGAVILKENFGVNEESVLDAVRWHTTGHPSMDDIGKALFIADYTEPGRDHISDSFRQRLYKMTLNEMMVEVLSMQIDFLRNSGNVIVDNTILLYDKLLSETGRKRVVAG